MITILIIAGGFLLIAIGTLLYHILTAPDGHEDAGGFHHDERKDTIWVQREMTAPSRNSHSLNA